MRTHAKAQSTGSTERRAGRLGRIVRGALATRASSRRGDGSGASSDGSGSALSRARLAVAGSAASLAAALAFFAAAASPAAAACPNEALRQGPSASLPDCRAYELVTPSSTEGRRVRFWGVNQNPRNLFSTDMSSSDGSRFVFGMGESSLAEPSGGTGVADTYVAERRSNDGWQPVQRITPSGTQALFAVIGGVSSDQAYDFVNVGANGGSLAISGSEGNYLRKADGTFELIGTGSLGTAPKAQGLWISPQGSHVIFTTVAGEPTQLEPNAPAGGIATAIYERGASGPTRVVSLLPGDVTPGAGENATYEGVSTNGSVVAFKIGTSLYARIDAAETKPVVDSAAFVGKAYECNETASAEEKRYQWLRNGVPIAGATSNFYWVTPADAGKVIQCLASAIDTRVNSGGSAAASEPILVPPAPGTTPPVPPFLAAPTQSATLTVGSAGGQTLTCNAGAWGESPTSYTYRWYRNGVEIGTPATTTATSETYTVTEADLASRAAFQCSVTGENAGGAVTKVSSTRKTSPTPSPSPNAFATVSNPTATFAGISENGAHVFYVIAGDAYVFDTSTGETVQITSTGDTELANVSADGSHVYFLSDTKVGGHGVLGEPNLYVWSRTTGETAFVATVAPEDLRAGSVGAGGVPALNRWTSVIAPVSSALAGGTGPGIETSRTTPSGSVFAFTSHAKLTSYENAGYAEVYRYDAASGSLSCASCNPNGTAASADARFEYEPQALANITPQAIVNNLSEDGNHIFFETSESLVSKDIDGVNDIYEWSAEASPSLSLISSGQTPLYTTEFGEHQSVNYLAAITPSGSDVFFATTEPLTGAAPGGGAPAIYDARVDGGFAEPLNPACTGEGCQPASSAPSPGESASNGFSGKGNVKQGRNCSASAHQARKLSERAKRLRRNAKKLARRNPKRAKQLRRKANKLAHRAKQKSQAAKSCRRANRRAAK